MSILKKSPIVSSSLILGVVAFFPGALQGSVIYSEDFESGAGGWTVDAGSVNSSWELGTPAGVVINSASSGTNAWVTNLTGLHPANENSAVESPAFNLSSLSDAKVQMDVWWEAELSWDGAVLQSSVDNKGTWQTVGGVGTGTNWYTDNAIDGVPGGQQTGWTGRHGVGSGGWVTAVHEVDSLAGQSAVFFRVAFGSDGSVQDDGFAFDNFTITDSTLSTIPEPTSIIGVFALMSAGVLRRERRVVS